METARFSGVLCIFGVNQFGRNSTINFMAIQESSRVAHLRVTLGRMRLGRNGSDGSHDGNRDQRDG